ncbi:flippase [Candidatus Azambacteria bacterium]|nr:flippase [Candidatus Azambacteria bacterium]MBI3685333.1 flippase [Candidatus Azambacteria bacterium]
MNELTRKIARNLTISVVGRFLSGALGIASVAFATRALGVSVFGEYNLVLTILYIFSVFGSFGLDPLLTREIAKEGADEKETIERIFFARCALLSVFLLLGVALVFFAPYSFNVKLGVALAAAGSFFFSLAQVFVGVFQRHLKTIIPAVAEVAVRGVQLTLSFYLYLVGGGIFEFLFVFVLGGTLYFIIAYYWVVVRTGFRFRMATEGFWDVLKEGWPLAVSAVLTLVYFRGDTVILSLMHSSRDVGIYGVAYKVLEHAIFIPIAFAGLVMPLLSRYAASDPARFRSVFQKAFDFLAIIALPFAVGGAYLSQGIVHILAGDGFGGAAAPLRILFVAIVFIFFGALFGNAIVALHKQKAALWGYGAAALLNTAANLYFIKQYSYMGAAAVTAVTEVFVTLFLFFLVWRTLRFFPSMRVLGKALGASGAMFLVLYFYPTQSFVALLFSGACSYAALIYLFKGVSKNDLLFLKQ